MKFKRVAAIDRCFSILELIERKKALGISEISNKLSMNKSTVFNTVHTLSALDVLENFKNKFSFGTRLYSLGKSAAHGSHLIKHIHPYLKNISRKTNLSAFLGARSGHKTIIIDKSDSINDLKISSEIGAKIPLVAGAHGKALLSLLSTDEIIEILSHSKTIKYIQRSGKSKKEYFDSVMAVKQQGFAFENEEYLEGIRAIAIPLNLKQNDIQCAIWAVGLKSQVKESSVKEYINYLLEIANKIESRI